jgi:hypothetical protein
MTPAHILDLEILSEQLHGRQKYGGSETDTTHDDQHTPSEWIDMIWDHCQRANVATPREYRHEMIKIAGLARSAVESFDSKTQ